MRCPVSNGKDRVENFRPAMLGQPVSIFGRLSELALHSPGTSL